jgi:Tfp pilus assembly protein PilF
MHLRSPRQISAVLLIALWACVCRSQEALPAPAAEWMQRGAEAIHEGKPAEAEKDFRLALAADPHSANAALALGMVLLRENKPAEARAPLEQAIAADPETRGAHMFLGILDYQQSKFDDALVSLNAEASLQPNNPEVLTWIGMVELAAGHPEQATTPLDHAAEAARPERSLLSGTSAYAGGAVGL